MDARGQKGTRQSERNETAEKATRRKENKQDRRSGCVKTKEETWAC